MKVFIKGLLAISLGFLSAVHANENKLDIKFLETLIKDVKTAAELPSATSIAVVQGVVAQ